MPRAGLLFQVVVPSDQLVSYVLGAFYSRADTERTFSRSVIACTSAALPALTPCTSPLVTRTTPFGSATFGSLFTNFALFGDGRINFSEFWVANRSGKPIKPL